MTTQDPSLVLYLPLDDILSHNGNPTTVDASGQGHDGLVHGAQQVVLDETFGQCLKFEASDQYVAVDKLAQAFPETISALTISGWVRPSSNPASDAAFFGFRDDKSADFYVRQLRGSNTLECRFRGSQGNAIDLNLAITPNRWQQIAFIYDGSQLKLYIDGQESKTTTASDSIAAAKLSLFQIGNQSHCQWSCPAMAPLAHARLYQRALSQDEIRRDRDADLMSRVAFRESHPLAFELFDQDEHYVMYIDDPDVSEGHLLKLAIRNVSDRAIRFGGEPAKPASPDNYHLELRFRPGILSNNTLKLLMKEVDRQGILKETEDWAVAVPAEVSSATTVDKVPAHKPISLYLLSKKASFSLKPNEPLAVTLQHISVEAGYGSRGTQVELCPHPRNLTYEGYQAPISGSRTQHLDIISHIGRKLIPLHVGFAGSNTVLNDGTISSLTLRFTNTDPSAPLSLNKATFTLQFVAGPVGEESALGTVDMVNKIAVKVGNKDIPKAAGGAGQVSEWTLTAGQGCVPLQLGALNTTAQPPDHFDVTLDNIITSHPTGQTNLYVHYDVPGYWEGQFVAPIEKTPLLFRGGNIELSNSDKAGTWFKLNNSSKGDNKDSSKDGVQWNIISSGEGNAEGAGKLLFNQAQRTKVVIDLQGNVGIGTIGPKIHLAIGDDGTGLHQQGDGKLALYTNNSERMRIDENGNVGIRVTNPGGALEVKGRVVIRQDQLVFSDESGKQYVDNWIGMANNIDGATKWLHIGGITDAGARRLMLAADRTYITGNVGLGTASPNRAKLEVTGVTGNTAALFGERGIALLQNEPNLAFNAYYSDGWKSMGGKLSSVNSAYGAVIGLDTTIGRLDVSMSDAGATSANDKLTIRPVLSITNNGNVGIGITAPKEVLHVKGSIFADGGHLFTTGMIVVHGGREGTHDWAQHDGKAWYQSDLSPSDLRLKQDILTIPKALAKVLDFRGVTFKWNELGLQHLTKFVESYHAGPGTTEEATRLLQERKRQESYEKLSGVEIGLIGQEVQQVAPELVAEDEDGYLRVAYDRLVALLVEAIKEQQQQIDTLTNTVSQLTSQYPVLK